MRNVLLLKAGETSAAVRLAVGDYDGWFLRTVGLAGYHFDVVPLHLGAKPPDAPSAYDAVLVTGSPLSVTRPEPWMERAACYLLDAAGRGVPVLGVCFGHQLLALAHGGRVGRGTRGREIGTVEVDLSPEGRADPLFAGLPPRFAVQATHEDLVEALPPGARLLAGNAHTEAQALAFQPHVRGVQFHPEAAPDAMRSMIQARAEGLEAEAAAWGLPRGERTTRLLAGLTPTPAGRRILVNFLTRFP
ncbi:glutamine amidotransferase [Myxococcaceae bacterium GXIMD 01537]